MIKYNNISKESFFNNNIVFYNENLGGNILNLKENFFKSLTLEYLENNKTILMISNNSNFHSLFTRLHNFENLNILQSANFLLFKEKNDELINNILNIILELYIYKKKFYDEIEENLEQNQKIIFDKRKEVSEIINNKKIKYKNFYYINIKNLLINEDLKEIESIFDLEIEDYLKIIGTKNINLIVNELKDNTYLHKGLFDSSVFLESNILSYNIRQLKFNLNVIKDINYKISIYFNSFNINSNYFHLYKFILIFNQLSFFLNKNMDIFYFKIPVIGINILKNINNLFFQSHQGYLINLTDITLTNEINPVIIKCLKNTSFILFNQNSINYLEKEKLDEIPLNDIEFLKINLLCPNIEKEKFITENFLILKILYSLLDIKDIIKLETNNDLKMIIKLLENYYYNIVGNNNNIDIEKFINLLIKNNKNKPLNKIEDIEKILFNENFK